MHQQNSEPYRPAWWMPDKEHLDYWKAFLTLLLLALAMPYMLKLLRRNPRQAAAVSSAI